MRTPLFPARPGARRTRPTAAATTARLVAPVTLLAIALTSCSGDSSDPAAGPADGSTGSSEATEAPPLETTSTMGKVTGKLPKDKRSAVRTEVTQAVDAWLDAAYVGGTYPRNDFADSWPGFTVGAKTDAQGDKALMSNQDIGSQIDAVDATARKVTVDVLAVKGRPAGATARFVLTFKTSGEVSRKVRVQGRLFLTPGQTPGDDGWRIFGYDVTKGRGA